MRIAFVGKGGAGKSTLSAILSIERLDKVLKIKLQELLNLLLTLIAQIKVS